LQIQDSDPEPNDEADTITATNKGKGPARRVNRSWMELKLPENQALLFQPAAAVS